MCFYFFNLTLPQKLMEGSPQQHAPITVDPCVLHVSSYSDTHIMRQSIYTVHTPPPAYPWAFELFEILQSNCPPPGQKCCSNALHIMEN
jgi:hypothetical protein